MDKQVNISYKCQSNTEMAWISDYHEDGYRGRLTDMVYEDGSDYTDWCVYAGSQEKCERFIKIFEKGGINAAYKWRDKVQQEAYERFLKNNNIERVTL